MYIYIYIFSSGCFQRLLILSFTFIHSDIGVHVDGFISNIAHSFVVGATKVLHSLLAETELVQRLVRRFEVYKALFCLFFRMLL